MSYPVRDARRRLRSRYDGLICEIDACADRVAEPWDTARTTNPNAVAEPFRTALESRGILERLPRVLGDVVDAMGDELSVEPVPAPPYVVVTSRGPILRATIDRGRLVVRFDAFAVERDSTPGGAATYRRRNGVVVDVSLV